MSRRSLRFLVRLAAVLIGAGGGAVAQGAPSWHQILRQPAAWYATTEAKAVADTVLLYQTAEGGWPKNSDFTVPPSAAFLASDKMDERAPTIDNGGTTTPMVLLARVHAQHADAAYASALNHALDYLFAAQYPNGGWPQYYPLHRGYYTHITYNDDATFNVMELLRQVARGEDPWTWVDADRRRHAQTAIDRGIQCILATQVRVDGVLTVWCAQHDETTLAPAAARKFEPVSLSGAESVGLVRILMAIEEPTPAEVQAIEAAVAWFKATRIADRRIERPRGPDGHMADQFLVPDRGGPGVWARFNEIGSNRPIFAGRDTIVHYDLAEVEPERRGGYAYYGTWAAKLLDREYPQWRARHLPATPAS